MSSTSPTQYVLGTGREELERLALQHRLWADAAQQSWRRAGIDVGQRILDVGCGPGFASFDLADMVTHLGAVVGIDESPNFISHLNAQASSRGLAQLRGVVGDVRRLGEILAGEAPFDLAYSRWVLCFVDDPGAVIRGIARLLHPGGHLVIHDYFNYHMMTTAPRRQSHDRAVEATVRAWKSRGGDPDVAGRLPEILAQAGMEMMHLEVHARVARKGDTMLSWPISWWRSFAPKLVAMELLAAADCDQLLRDLDEIADSDRDFIQCPPVYEIVARKS